MEVIETLHGRQSAAVSGYTFNCLFDYYTQYSMKFHFPTADGSKVLFTNT